MPRVPSSWPWRVGCKRGIVPGNDRRATDMAADAQGAARMHVGTLILRWTTEDECEKRRAIFEQLRAVLWGGRRWMGSTTIVKKSGLNQSNFVTSKIRGPRPNYTTGPRDFALFYVFIPRILAEAFFFLFSLNSEWWLLIGSGHSGFMRRISKSPPSPSYYWMLYTSL